MSDSPWEFFIDVGGTFTDCIARSADGRVLRRKILSSGVTKGRVGQGGDPARIVDVARRDDPDGFWDGFELRLVDAAGAIVDRATVAAFDRAAGTLSLSPALVVSPAAGQGYELFAGDEAPILAIRHMLGLGRAAALPPLSVRLGTTRGTNALLTRRGARTALAITRGFGDVLRIGYQNRPRLFDLDIRKHEPLYTDVVEIDERVTHDGQVLAPLDEDAVRRQLTELLARGVESLAICLLHAYRHAEHERVVERIAREVGFGETSASHRVAPLVKIVPRGDTTTVDAYLNPILRAYVERLSAALAGAALRIMTSSGGLVSADRFVGKDSILSGPAGGVVGFSQAARAAGFSRAIGFDMGGTSTDVARHDGKHELEYETEKAGVRVVAPMMAIETVAAGGGSICRFDGVKLVVGPESAGAEPGPACYGRGGPLCVTDLNFYLGKIIHERFPFHLDRAAVEARLAEIAASVERATGRRYTPVELCDGFLRVANANMVKAIQSISVAKGCDPRQYVLVAFGGAAGQHACAVARELGMRQVLSHPDAGLLSAHGIGQADVSRHRAMAVYRGLSRQAVAELESDFAAMADEATREVLADGIARGDVRVVRSLDLRYRGLDAYLTVAEREGGDHAADYEAEHERLYGHRHDGRAIEIVAARVEVVGRTRRLEPAAAESVSRQATAERTVTAHFDARECATSVFDRSRLRPGDRLIGPAIVYEPFATTIVDFGWKALVLPRGELLLEDEGGPRSDDLSTEADPVMLEIFNGRFTGIAERMGIALRNTSTSVNVKERLDFSCAIFDAAGNLVVNAPHVPVHLGAMGQTVRCVLADNPSMRPGDVFVTNDPYRGGSHLPDVTVVTPVHDPLGGRLRFFTASRAHHAEIGGIRPGSMPPFSTNLAEEGVLIQNFKLVDAGRSRMDELQELLLSGEHPTRNVHDNLADVSAQVAANHQGAVDLNQLVERCSWPVVEAYMGHIQRAAERKMRRALARLPEGAHSFTDHMDDGGAISVTVTVAHHAEDDATAVIDFGGTAGVSRGNLNANRAIATSAVMYCLRCLIAEDIPLNEGVLAAVEIVLPECMLNPSPGPTPASSPAVVGGNVETSQRAVDALLGAFKMAAASQGTMNNVLFGDGTFGYYETICGGAGATRNADGAAAIHTHMTNTRLTDPEVLELRYPVRVREFSIRRGSGGRGARRGGDGITRRLEFLRPLEVSILSQRRGPYAPYGVCGGEPGGLGRNTLTRADGTVELLPGAVQFTAQAGDVLTIETPGGGGWGRPLADRGDDEGSS